MVKKKKTVEIENRKARHMYEVIESLECGISLRGNEVKSIASGMANIGEAWVSIEDNQLILRNARITRWDTANAFDVSENRDRVLLAHKNEIMKYKQAVKEKGLTLIPLKIYFKDGKAKLLLGLCKGMHSYDIRHKEAEKTMKREIARTLAHV